MSGLQRSANTLNEASVQSESPARRPNATAEEKRWRDENWSRRRSREASATQERPANDIPIDYPDDNASLRLARELQQFAMEETSGSSLDAQPAMPFRSRYQPKLPPQRHRDRTTISSNHKDLLEDSEAASQDTLMRDASAPQNDDEVWEYHTYVIQPYSADTSTEADPTVGEDNFGFLVITESDEEAWEQYGEDEDSADDWNSEEEDENGTSSAPHSETPLPTSLPLTHSFLYSAPQNMILVAPFFSCSLPCPFSRFAIAAHVGWWSTNLSCWLFS